MSSQGVRSLRAEIEYRSTAKEAAGATHVRGREWMSLTCYADGSAMYRSQSENDDKGLVREVLMRLDAQWRPIECFFDLRAGGAHAGSALGDASSGLSEEVWCLAGTPLFLQAEIRGSGYPTRFVTTKLEIVGDPDRKGTRGASLEQATCARAGAERDPGECRRCRSNAGR